MGLLKSGDMLALVDGHTNKSTLVDRGEIGVGPSLTSDGTMVTWTKQIYLRDLKQVESLLSTGLFTQAQRVARDLREATIEQRRYDKEWLSKNSRWASRQEGRLAELVYRIVAQEAGHEFLTFLKPKERELFDALRREGVKLCQLYCARVDGDLVRNRQVLVTMPFDLTLPRISPDKQFVAFILHDNQTDRTERFDLFVTARDGSVRAARVATQAALGYSWRPDSQGLTFLRSSTLELEETVLGTLTTRDVVNDQGRLHTREVTLEDHYDGISSHYFGEPFDDLAGVLFTPWSRVTYHPSGRIMFNSMAMQLPTSSTNEGRHSLFAYDPEFNTVLEVLPPGISAKMALSLMNYSLSPSGTHLLLPTRHNRFLIYRLGDTDAIEPLGQADEFGDEQLLELAPAWKGDGQFTCLVSGECSLLPNAPASTYQDREVVLLNLEGRYQQRLSDRWSKTIQEDPAVEPGPEPRMNK